MSEDQVIELAETETDPTVLEEPETVDQDTEEPEQPEKKFTQAELDAIVQKAKAKAERKARQRVEQEYAQRQPPPAAPTPKAAEPKRTDFENDADWIDAKIEYREQLRDLERKQLTVAQQAEQIRAKALDLFDAAEDLPLFDREVFDTLTITDAMSDALLDMDSSHAAQVMAYMTANVAEAEKLSSLSPVRQVNALFKISDKLTERTKKTLPEPPDRVNGGNAPISNDIMKMTPEQYKAFRAKQGAWWAK